MNHGDHENTERSAAGCVELATHQPACRRRRARQAHWWSRPPRFAFWGTGFLTKLFSQSSPGSLCFKVLDYVGKEVQHALVISISEQEPTACYHGREPVVRTGAAPNLGREADPARGAAWSGLRPRLGAAPV